jgi:D-alanyl-D-alanine-carboxypeptidase/D-alanyl-D-alanine-endopeptidase
MLLGVVLAGCDGSGGTSRAAPRPIVTKGSTTPATPPSTALTRVFDTIHRRYKGEILGMCMGAIDQETSAVKCYGRVGRGSRKRPGPRTLFQIGSISKTFTGTLLALRVSDGSVGLRDPVRRYLPPGKPQVPAAMTLLDLAQHYSGLPRSTPYYGDHVPSLKRYFAVAGPCATSSGCRYSAPGRRYSYSNYAYGLLGELLGTHDGYKDSGASAWEHDNDANVAGPLGLSDTHSWFGWRAISPATFNARRARATVEGREPRPPYFPPAPYADPAGGLYSTANDMVKWLSFSMGLTGTPALNAARPYLYDTPDLLRPRENRSDKSRRIGVAWRADRHGSGAARATCVYKDGLTRGFTASMIFEKSRGVGAFVMLNTAPENTPSIAAALVNSLPSAARVSRHLCGGGG